MNQLRVRLSQGLYRVAQVLEILIGGILVIAILVSIYSVMLGLDTLVQDAAEARGFQSFLALVFNVIIGIEFLKMLCRHNMGSTIEVLLFAIARQMVVEHTSPMENLLTILAIAILFLIRKFLFIPGVDDKHDPQTADTDGLDQIEL